MKKVISLLLLVVMLCPFAFADANGLTEENVDKMDMMIDQIIENYNVELTTEQLIDAAYRGMMDALDTHSYYMDADELADYNSGLSGSFVGVGMSIVEKGDFIEVLAPIADSPALAAGIMAGDLIIAVDGTSIKGKSIDDVVSLIKGEIDTPVSLTIERKGQAQPLIFNLKRALVVMKSVTYQNIDGVDVIKISSFDANTASQMEDILVNQASSEKMIIDLRNNPGGYLDQVVEVANLFLPKGKTICSVDYRNYQDELFESGDDGLTVDLVVLVNGSSASASEIFAAAMQDNDRATIVGQKTYGKGTVQSVYNLGDGSALKMTIAKYATPNGRFIDGIGVTPDVVVETETVVDPKVDNFYPMQSLNTSSLGSKDIDTYGLEQRLNYMGYDIEVDGLFDRQTEDVLKRYQTEHDMVADGRLTVEAKIAIQRDVIAMATKPVDNALEIALRIIK